MRPHSVARWRPRISECADVVRRQKTVCPLNDREVGLSDQV
jgi:hypothetical protein